MKNLFVAVVVAGFFYGIFFIGNTLYRSGRVFLNNQQKADYFYELATASRAGGNDALAQQQLERAIELVPDSKKVNLLLGDIHADAGRMARAIGCYERGISFPNTPDKDDVETLFRIVKYYMTNEAVKAEFGFKKCYNEAVKIYKMILELDPGNHKALLGSALALTKTGQHSAARKIIDNLLLRDSL
ncbi:MAG: tetratricopeptide repeat protein, partial [Candidatus Wallbacteria bacterium]|nr:tetratricopeptide repeat protein [Candidatus Wallbacteria bacterium]